jgi:hypothetical protein
MIFYVILVKEVGESKGEGSILEETIKVSRVDAFSGFPGCLVEWLLFRSSMVRSVMKFCRALE